MHVEKKIAILVCYFGKLPWYFHYFIHTCRFNATIQFILITDNIISDVELSSNIIAYYQTLPELALMVSKKLGFQVSLSTPYKLCDYKPAYGMIFSEFIEGFDFWGYSDIDVVFGDIRDFIGNELLNDYDLISVRPDWIPGCFMIFKNSEKMKYLFTESKDFKKIYSTGRHFCFDETNFSHHSFTEGIPYFEISTEVESMMHVVKKMEDRGYIKPYFDMHILEGGSPGFIKWESGKLLYRNKYEILLYHLINFKKHYVPTLDKPLIGHKFNISKTRIYNQKLAR